MSKTALLLVDVQNDYFNGGSMALPAMEAAAGNIAGLLAHFRQTDWLNFNQIDHFWI